MSKRVDELDNLYGFHAVEAVLNRSPRNVLEIWLDRNRRDQRAENIQAMARSLGVNIVEVERSELDKQVDGNHQGVIARCHPQTPLAEAGLWELLDRWPAAPLLLILDGVTDPHNLGACLRTAEAAGVMAVVVPKSKAAGLSPTVQKVSCGASQLIPLVQVSNLARFLKQLKEQGVWLVGTSDSARQSLYETDLSGGVAIIMGSEGKGLRRLTAELCDWLVTIPMAGFISSLNVSVAAGVCLFEVVRQRKIKEG